MDRTERFYRLEQLIRSRGCVSFDTLLDELEVSRATLKRDLQYLRDRMDAPIVYDRDDNGYRLAPAQGAAGGQAEHQLPGVWFSEKELHALLTMHQLISGLDDGGVLSRHLQPLLAKVQGMLGQDDSHTAGLMRRVRIVHPARRPVASRFFEEAGSALLSRRRLRIRYWSRAKRSESVRDVSPQRLLHYRNTWYLDAWCHASEGLRRFALDAVREAQVLDTKAKDVSPRTVEAELDQGYGIFGGDRVQTAILDFNPEAAQWVQQEEWHPRQELTPLADGGVRMRLPYTDPTELVMDILRHGPGVRVAGPVDLKRKVTEQLQKALQGYDAAAPVPAPAKEARAAVKAPAKAPAKPAVKPAATAAAKPAAKSAAKPVAKPAAKLSRR